MVVLMINKYSNSGKILNGEINMNNFVLVKLVRGRRASVSFETNGVQYQLSDSITWSDYRKTIR